MYCSAGDMKSVVSNLHWNDAFFHEPLSQLAHFVRDGQQGKIGQQSSTSASGLGVSSQALVHDGLTNAKSKVFPVASPPFLAPANPI